MCPHLESCFQGQHLIPKDRAHVKGPKKGSDMIKGTWGRDFQIGEGEGRRGERERERLRPELPGGENSWGHEHREPTGSHLRPQVLTEGRWARHQSSPPTGAQ